MLNFQNNILTAAFLIYTLLVGYQPQKKNIFRKASGLARENDWINFLKNLSKPHGQREPATNEIIKRIAKKIPPLPLTPTSRSDDRSADQLGINFVDESEEDTTPPAPPPSPALIAPGSPSSTASMLMLQNGGSPTRAASAPSLLGQRITSAPASFSSALQRSTSAPSSPTREQSLLIPLLSTELTESLSPTCSQESTQSPKFKKPDITYTSSSYTLPEPSPSPKNNALLGQKAYFAVNVNSNAVSGRSRRTEAHSEIRSRSPSPAS